MASVRDKLPAFIAEIENGFSHETLLTVIQKIYFEYWLRRWLVTYRYMANPIFYPPLHTLKQITDGVWFRTSTNLSGQSLSGQFNPDLLKTVGEERLAWAPPSSEDGYQHYKDRYWYMDYYEGPYPVTDDVSPVEAGLEAIANRSAFVLPGHDSPGPRLHSYNIHPYLKPTDIDTTSPYDPEGSHETYLTDLNYNGLAPGFNQKTAHVFLAYIIPRLLDGTSGLFLNYRRHDAPWAAYTSLEELCEDAEIDTCAGMLERDGASSAYSLARPKVYVDLLKILQALKIYQIVHDFPWGPTDLFEWHEDLKTVTYYDSSGLTTWPHVPDWAAGTLGPLPTYYDSRGTPQLAYRMSDAKGPWYSAPFTRMATYPYTPLGPPYSLASAYEALPTPRYPTLNLQSSLAGSIYSSGYSGTGNPITWIVPLNCRYLDFCTIKQVHQRMEVSGWHEDWGREPVNAVTARPVRFSTSWGLEFSVPSGFRMFDGPNANIRFNRACVRQEVAVGTFQSSLIRELGEVEAVCEYRDHYPPLTHGLACTNRHRATLGLVTHPYFDCILDATGAFELFSERDGLPAEFDWQLNPFDGDPYKEWLEA